MPFLKPINLSSSESKPHQHLALVPNRLLPSKENESIQRVDPFGSTLGSLLATNSGYVSNRSIVGMMPEAMYGFPPPDFLSTAAYNGNFSLIAPVAITGCAQQRLEQWLGRANRPTAASTYMNTYASTNIHNRLCDEPLVKPLDCWTRW
jgi:hypothetical protein